VIEALRPVAAERWREARPDRPALAGALLIGAGKGESSKVSFLFMDASGRPALVAKVARNDVARRALDAEQAALLAVRATGSAAVASGAPEPLGRIEVDGRATLLMSALDGRPLFGDYHTPGHTTDRATVASDLRAAGDWLGAFQRETTSARVPIDDAFVRAHVAPVLDRYREVIGWGPAEDELFGAVGERLARMEGITVPLVASHGDFWMGNLLLQGGRVTGVIDWEVAGMDFPPFRDLYKFPTSYAFYMDRAYPGRGGAVPNHPGREDRAGRWRRFGGWPNLLGFGYGFFGTGWFPDLVRGFVLGHLESIGVPAEVNAAFFPLFLAEQATVLDVQEFRDGYRSLIRAFAAERETCWLWTHSGEGAPLR